MIVVDTSAAISLAAIDILDTVLSEFDVHTTGTVREELRETAEYDDRHGDAAESVLDNTDRIEIHSLKGEFTSSRVDRGEGSCALLANEISGEFLITDDLRALPELQQITDANVAISPIVLKALVERAVLERDQAVAKVEELAEQRDWLGAPIYSRATKLFE